MLICLLTRRNRPTAGTGRLYNAPASVRYSCNSRSRSRWIFSLTMAPIILRGSSTVVMHRTQRFHPSVQIVEFAVAPPHLPRLAVGATRTNHDGAHAVCRVLAIACAHCLSHARCDDQLAVLAKLTAICTGDCAGDRVSGPGQAYCSECRVIDGMVSPGGRGRAAQTWHSVQGIT